MSKKVMKSSNKNEKLRMVLSNNLKDALDIERILSDLNIKMNINTLSAIGCAGIIASCGEDKPKDDGKKDESKLKWEALDDKLKNKFDNNEELFEKFINKCKDFTNDDLTNLINKLEAEEITEVINSKENITKDENGSVKIGNRTININEKEPEKKNENIKGLEYDKLPEKIKGKLNKLDENNKEFVKEFWNKIRNEENIDELIKNDKDLNSKYENFKQEKENSELIKNQLTRANFNSDDQTKINGYISYIDDTLKVKLNNNTAKQYLLNQLKEKEKQSEIVKCVESLYKQVISEGKIKTEIKKQLKTIIKTCFEKLISEDESYKRNIEIKDTDITIEDNGKVKVKFTSKNVKNPQANEYIIEQEFFGIDTDKLKCVEIKDGNKESEKELELQKLIDAENNAFYNYTFSENDKNELNKLVTSKSQTPPNTIKAKIESIFKNHKIENITDYTSLKTEAKKIQTLLSNIAVGRDGQSKDIEKGKTISDIYKEFDSDPTKWKTAFETAVNAWIKQHIIDKPTDGLKAKVNAIKTSDADLKKNVCAASKLMEITDLLKTTETQFAGTTALTYLNTKFTNDFKTNYIGNNNSKIEFGNTGEVDIDNFVIGNDFENITKDTTNIKGKGDVNADEKINLTSITGLLKTKLSSKFDNSLKVVKKDSESDLKTIGDRFLAMLDNVNIGNASTYAFETTLDDYVDTSKFVEAKKFADLKDADLNALVEPVLTSVFGTAATCKAVFDKLNAIAVLNICSDDASNNRGNAKAMNDNAKGSIANISEAGGGGGLPTSQTNFTTDLGTELWALRVALDDLYKDASDASNEWKTMLKEQIFGQLYFDVTNGKGTDDAGGGPNANIPCIAMKNTLLFKWLYVTQDKYVANYAGKKACIEASIQRILHLRFADGMTLKGSNNNHATKNDTKFFTLANDNKSVSLLDIGKTGKNFSDLTFVLPLSANGISIDGAALWNMGTDPFIIAAGPSGNNTKELIGDPIIFVADQGKIEANYLLGMCGDWNGNVAQYKIGYYGSGGIAVSNFVTKAIQYGVNPV